MITLTTLPETVNSANILRGKMIWDDEIAAGELTSSETTSETRRSTSARPARSCNAIPAVEYEAS